MRTLVECPLPLALLALGAGGFFQIVSAERLKVFCYRLAGGLGLLALFAPVFLVSLQGTLHHRETEVGRLREVVELDLPGGSWFWGLLGLGHLVFGVWLLRRRARGEAGHRALAERQAAQRRERHRLPPRGLDGGAS